MLRAYDAALQARPLQTKLASAFVIFGTCELNAQLLTSEAATREGATLSDRVAAVKLAQVAGFACFSFYNAPLMHTFYRVTLAQNWPLVPRIAANCLIVDPANFSVAILLSSTNKGLAMGHDLSTACSLAVDTWRDRFMSTFAAGLTCWPAAHLINNWLVPHRYRVLFFNMGSLCWNTYLTYTLWVFEKARGVGEKQATPAKEMTCSPAEATQVERPRLVAVKGSLPSTAHGAQGNQRTWAGWWAGEKIGGGSNGGTADDARLTAATLTNGEANVRAPGKCPFRFAPGWSAQAPCMRPNAPSTASTAVLRTDTGETGSSTAGSEKTSSCAAEDKNSDGARNRRAVLNSSDYKHLFGTDSLIGPAGDKVPVSSLVGKSLALYFSGHWCPPCRRYTPHLSETYRSMRESRKDDFEIIFVSSDHDEESFNEYRSTMPWLAIPYEQATERTAILRTFFGVPGVPWLVTLDETGLIANKNARSAILKEWKDFPSCGAKRK
jgi:thiol-disulfide isomerase/thioredoxin